MLSMSSVRSVVGGTASSANPEKMTRPIRILSGWSSTNARVACWATVSRFGLTSVAHIEPETSSARMIDVRATATSRSTCGRPAATPSATRLSSSNAIGRCRCQRVRFGSTERRSATLE